MKKIILSIFALLISIAAMAQTPEHDNPVLNFQSAGLSFPLESEETTIEVNDQRVTFAQIIKGECDANVLNNLSSFKIYNENYQVNANIIEYSKEEMENMSNVLVKYLMEHMNDSVPNSRTLKYSITPDEETGTKLASSSLTYGGFFKEKGVVDETIYMSYSFIYVRATGHVVALEIFGNPQYADYLNEYSSRCVNLDDDFVTTELFPEAKMKTADDGVNFLEQLLLKMQSFTNEQAFVKNSKYYLGSTYYTYKQLFGSNAPSYKGQDKVLTKEEKAFIQKTAETNKMERQVRHEKKELEKMEENLLNKQKDVKTVKKLK